MDALRTKDVINCVITLGDYDNIPHEEKVAFKKHFIIKHGGIKLTQGTTLSEKDKSVIAKLGDKYIPSLQTNLDVIASSSVADREMTNRPNMSIATPNPNIMMTMFIRLSRLEGHDILPPPFNV